MDAIPGGSAEDHVSISRRMLVKAYKNSSSKNNAMKFENFVTWVKNTTRCEKDLSSETKKVLSKLVFQFKSKWQSANRTSAKFNRKEKCWLDGYIHFPVSSVTGTFEKVGGRPRKEFSESSERSKRRKTEELRLNTDTKALSYAAQMKLRAEGDLRSANIIKALGSRQHENTESSHTQITSDKALSLVVGAKLTKFQYNLMRDIAKENNCNLYPNYEAVTEAKKRCYPKNLSVTETMAETTLQSLLNHTAIRLCCDALQEIFSSLIEKQLPDKDIWLISKWGCDGTSGQAEYKQKFTDKDASDASIFITSLVPVQIILGEPTSKTNIIVWQNPHPSSPRYCRPLSLKFSKETTELTRKVTKEVEDQIRALENTEVIILNKKILVKHHLIMTMVDGKIVNAVTDTASQQRCYLCGLTSKDFNRVSLCLNKEIEDTKFLEFGISPLHAWIRLFECLLHIAYKLPILKWQARTTDDKNMVNAQKKKIQEEFRTRLGLLVDKPKPGYGSSNDGNTARRFFSNIQESSEITGLNQDLIKNMHVIRLSLSSGFPLNCNKFKKYCFETAELYVQYYEWYPMPTSLHKILIHGHQIVQHAIMPIGLLSEEAQETKNKDIKRFRQGFSRKMSREKTMEDVFHNILISSDPFISSLQKTQKKTGIQPYPKEVLDLFEIIE